MSVRPASNPARTCCTWWPWGERVPRRVFFVKKRRGMVVVKW
jgi:hypothetical protein